MLIQINNFMKKINGHSNGAEKRIEITVDNPVHLHAFRVNTRGDSVTSRAAGGWAGMHNPAANGVSRPE